MYYMCTHDLTQTVDGNVSQSSDNISKTQKWRGCIELLTLNEENSIQLSNSDNPSLNFNELKRKNRDRIIIGHININFIENKFEALVALVKDKVDIIMISETKIDDSFKKNQFLMKGYSTPPPPPFRLDRNAHGGGILIYIRDDMPSKKLKSKLPADIEGIFIEINIRNIKWVLMGGYNPQKEKISYFLCHVSKGLDKYLGNYENICLKDQ